MPQQPTLLANLWAQYGRPVLLLCVFALLLHDIFGAHGYLAMRRTRAEIAKTQSELDRLNKENEKLAEQVTRLKSDPKLIESIARDELGLAKPGDTVVKIPQGQQFHAQ
ncbi:MAG TPA: septum formation initiator family protein [Dongiaceae bacterium]|nr:septum formation initiator family protein [Dongiaceae bacterium]